MESINTKRLLKILLLDMGTWNVWNYLNQQVNYKQANDM